MNFIQEKLLFLYKFVRSPKQIGSVTPSSAYLALRMLGQVPWMHVDSIAELGAGTGAITKHIGKVARNKTRVVLFEKDPFLLNELQKKYPEYSSHQDALLLREVLDTEGIPHLDCIISGLPFFNFSPLMRDRLLDQIVRSLKPGGLFIAFQYSQQMKPHLNRLFHIREVHFVPLNLPPAFVYVCEKRDSQRPVHNEAPSC